jgi:hypothetical protein
MQVLWPRDRIVSVDQSSNCGVAARKDHTEGRALPRRGLQLYARIEQLAQSLHDGKSDSFARWQWFAAPRRA